MDNLRTIMERSVVIGTATKIVLSPRLDNICKLLSLDASSSRESLAILEELFRSPLRLNVGKIVLRFMRSEDVPELTRISSKGQVVIPSRVRQKLGIEAGSVFAILTPRKGNVVVLKKIDNKSLQADLRVFREVERAWREIERGQARRASRKRFLEELETW